LLIFGVFIKNIIIYAEKCGFYYKIEIYFIISTYYIFCRFTMYRTFSHEQMMMIQDMVSHIRRSPVSEREKIILSHTPEQHNLWNTYKEHRSHQLLLHKHNKMTEEEQAAHEQRAREEFTKRQEGQTHIIKLQTQINALQTQMTEMQKQISDLQPIKLQLEPFEEPLPKHLIPQKQYTICTFPGCITKARSNNLCQKHKPTCSIPVCRNNPHANGLCNKHSHLEVERLN
jgi:hypothetical protein